MALKGRKLRKRVQELVLGEMRFRMGLPGNGGICPWCGEVALPQAKGEALVDAVLAHLEACPTAKGDPETPLKTGVAIQEIVRFRVLKAKVQAEPAYRVFGHDARWLCPFCAEFQDIRAIGPDGKRLDANRLVQLLSHHLNKCYEHQAHPDRYLSVAQLKERMVEITHEKKFREGVTDLIKSNPIMGFTDRDGKWVCPFCKQSIHSIDMSTPIQREHAAPRRVAQHLSKECAVAVENPALAISHEEMEDVVAKINEEKQDIKAAQEAKAEDPGSTAYIRDLREQVMDLRDDLKRNDDLSRALERARQVQQRMLPAELPEVPGYELEKVFEPCDEVSGDFYDMFLMPSGRLCIVIADVSGHGLDAALVMGMAKKSFSVRAQEDTTAAEILCKVNVDIKPDLEDGRFITASLSVLDPVTHSLSVTRAGHNPAILWRAATKKVALIKPPGMMVGVDKGPRFEKVTREEEVSLEPGDVVVQYTDGVTEAMNKKDDEFGMGRLTDAVARAAAAPAEVILASISAAIQKFVEGRPQEDDVTLLVVRRLP